MKKKLLSIGSCQSTMILKYLRTQEQFDASFETSIPAKQVYQMDDNDIDKLHAQISDVDVLLIQPVTDGYKNQYQVKQPPGALSAKTLIGKLKKDSQVIISPVMFFNAYHPSFFRPGVRYPSDNHDVNLLGLFAKHARDAVLTDNHIEDVLDEYIEKTCLPEIYSKTELESKASSGIDSLLDKESGIRSADYCHDVKCVPIAGFVKDNWRRTLLFSTCNHPTHTVYTYLVSEVGKLLDIHMADLPNLQPHAADVGTYYRCLEQVVEFDVAAAKPSLDGKHTVRDVARLYVAAYNDNRESMIAIAKRFASR